MTNEQQNIIVIKIGSSTLINKEGNVDYAYLDALAQQIDTLRKQGWKPVIVSSGAIACGLKTLGIKTRPTDMPSLQAAASVGQNAFINAYAQVFGRYDIITSVVLMTRHTTRHRESYLHARDTLERLLELDVVPIINENDTVSVEQIRFGDNDTLAALVSCLIKARICVIFSDIDGLHTENPHDNPRAPLITHVEKITPEIMASAGGAGTNMGSGGMITKIRAARVLMIAGIELVICLGEEPNALLRIVAGEEVGTRFSARETFHEITPKKLWIALGDSAKGTIVVDDGAKKALLNNGSSLLAVGVLSTHGAYEAGDIVDITDQSGYLFGRGKVGACSSEVVLACGRSQQEIKQNTLFRDLSQKPVVHRDELVVFE